MMKIFGRMVSMDLSFTHMVPLNPVVSLLLILEQVGDKNGHILDINTDEIRYVLVNIYTEVEQVQVLRKLSKLMKNINILEESCTVFAGKLNVVFDIS